MHVVVHVALLSVSYDLSMGNLSASKVMTEGSQPSLFTKAGGSIANPFVSLIGGRISRSEWVIEVASVQKKCQDKRGCHLSLRTTKATTP